ncbi:IDEAL domain-containing protein [Alicyclobacillus fastidiosus]|uniref:IDEAL domain-containing protein n=1 Tax=Alicyclobacillus fastidiosus TaxID=392011 RepID=A0ABY6ZBV4_9BACL|nr:IDEAL domain-containing protein [Alicyclobacillus fastidiosus]WAH40329.1 IDEAL domain-containing protein [Alicyclobacillus fastidiosus]GMA61712.1 hypothetical protein GCM10025859_21520 [Alicyclobacillus fastidiosus]
MDVAKLQFGDWVSFLFQHQALLGFIVKNVPEKQSYVIFVPSTGKHYTCPASMAIPEEPTLKPNDVQALIDLSLDLKDEEWFRELSRRYLNKSR